MSRAIVNKFYSAKANASKDPKTFSQAMEDALAAGYRVSPGGFLTETAKVKPEPKAPLKPEPTKAGLKNSDV